MKLGFANPVSIGLVLFSLGVVLASGGCAKPQQMLNPAEKTPAALGEVTTSVDHNGNTELHLKVDHLPPPQALSPDARTFVVWIRPVGSDSYLNVGQLRVSEDRTGQLTAKTPYQQFDVQVTAEASGSAAQPSKNLVLQGRAARKE